MGLPCCETKFVTTTIIKKPSAEPYFEPAESNSLYTILRSILILTTFLRSLFKSGFW
jgi:hypothetical protein